MTGFKPEYSVSSAINEIIEAFQSGKLKETENCYTVKWMKSIGLAK